MKLGDGVEAAIHCAAFMARVEEGRTLPASALAEYHGVSQSYLLKHLKALVAAGILESVPGPHGGYRLARAPERISLLHIVTAIEGGQPAFRCADIRKRNPGGLDDSVYKKPCAINVAMLRAENAYRNALAQTKLSELVDDFYSNADPRSVAYACHFRERHLRPPAIDYENQEK